MANDINKFICTGRIGKIEVRYTANNIPIADVSIAIGSYKKNGDNFEDVTDWANFRAFNRLAEQLGKIGKGEKLAIEEHFKQNKYQDKDGNTKYNQYFIIDKFEVLGKSHDRLKSELWDISKLNKKPERLFQEGVILFLKDAQGQSNYSYKQLKGDCFKFCVSSLLQIISHSIIKMDHKPIHGNSPIFNWHCPFLCSIFNRQINHFFS